MESRLKHLQQSSQRWCNGYLLLENEHCLIEDEEGDIMMPESLQSPMILIKESGLWRKGELLGTVILHENGQLIDVQGGEIIQYTQAIAKGWLDLLLSVPENVFYQVIEILEQYDFSVYDCVFSSFHPFHRASFFQFSTDTHSLALQYHRDSASGLIRFEWTTSSGHRSISQFHVT
ncbi:DUF2777 family protein [Bacillus sp. Bos-x628]|uniref:DUF2777 family protein n=1 Tax=Bacillus maqinnsis TaxID=3229854 RepID=UPI00338F190A